LERKVIIFYKSVQIFIDELFKLLDIAFEYYGKIKKNNYISGSLKRERSVLSE